MAEAIITRRGASGIKPFVVSTSYSKHPNSEGATNQWKAWFDTEYGVKAAYFENGDVFISAQSIASSCYVDIIVDSIPEGTSVTGIVAYRDTAYSQNRPSGFVLSGATSNLAVTCGVYYNTGGHLLLYFTVTEV